MAKQFFKSKSLYGAESYINGFSGHVLDILISNYSSLQNLILQAKTWQEVTFIDINSQYRDFEQASETLNSDKLSNLIVIDPIIKERNAAKALRAITQLAVINETNVHHWRIQKDG